VAEPSPAVRDAAALRRRERRAGVRVPRPRLTLLAVRALPPGAWHAILGLAAYIPDPPLPLPRPR
jgi:hypothetical protein